ncbi:fused MFS/spermidine synthase [Patescibacteria group bacterium]
MKKIKLELIVFFSGGLVMILELVGSRVVAPYLGSSLFIWTSLIGVILASLSAGYYLGGLIADKYPDYKKFSLILLLGGVAVGIMTIIKVPVLEFISSSFSNIRISSTIAALILFAPASVLLGMVSPYAVRLKIHNVKKSGRTVGTLYAISTIGSITGTFLAGFVLIPNIGSSNILYIITILLILLSIVAYSPKVPVIKSAVIILFLAGFYYTPSIEAAYMPEGLIDVDTQYNRVWIYNDIDKYTDKPIKRMRLNSSASSAMFLDSNELVFIYSKYYELAEHFNPGFEKTLLIGGAAYSYPKYFLEKYPDATMDVVEIDPELTELAKEHFGLKEDPRLKIIHEDGRTYLNNTEEKYDVIYGDAFKEYFSIPYHLTTQEAIQKMYDSLNDNGVLLINLIGALEGEKGQMLRAEYATLKSVFPQVYIFTAQKADDPEAVQNLMVIAYKSDNIPVMVSSDPDINYMLNRKWNNKIEEDMPILTDEFAPVDAYVDKML